MPKIAKMGNDCGMFVIASFLCCFVYLSDVYACASLARSTNAKPEGFVEETNTPNLWGMSDLIPLTPAASNTQTPAFEYNFPRFGTAIQCTNVVVTQSHTNSIHRTHVCI